MTSDLLQNHILFNTLCRGFLIRDSVACTAVKQSVVSSRRSCGYVETLDQQDSQPPEGAVPCCSGSRNATTDDYDIIFIHLITVQYIG